MTKKKKTTKKEKYAYTITDVVFGEFKVLRSANAWWMDSVKVRDLINAFKYDSTITEARIAAGISKEQWDYFVDKHPDFYGVMEACKEVPGLKARQHVVGALGSDLTTSRWYLERKKAAEFGTREKVEVENGDLKITIDL